MRTLTSKEFGRKVTALSASSRVQLSRVLSFLEKATQPQLVSGSRIDASVLTLTDTVSVIRVENLDVYFSISSDVQGEYALLLDVTERGGPPQQPSFFAVNDPRTNSSLNPKFSPSLNPLYNSSINPRYNSSINPRYNSSINPRYNSSINPRYNSSINPRYNSSINPRYNSSINPRYNSSINPRFNRAYGGPFLYSVELIQEGFVVGANDQVSIIFDMEANFSGIVVLHDDGIRIAFNEDSEWIGYWVPSESKPLLRFDCDGEWTGLVV